MARAAYTLTIREGPRVSRHPHETLEDALDDLRGELDRLAGEGGLPEVKMIRTFSPDKRVKARLEISTGGLLAMWFRLQQILYPWYEQLQHEALNKAVLHADETGWRVDGQTHWLWCFADPDLSFFLIHRSSGSPASKDRSSPTPRVRRMT